MTRVPLRSVPTGPGVSTGGAEDERHHGVELGSEGMDADLEQAIGTAVIGSTPAVVAASLLDFLR